MVSEEMGWYSAVEIPKLFRNAYSSGISKIPGLNGLNQALSVKALSWASICYNHQKDQQVQTEKK